MDSTVPEVLNEAVSARVVQEMYTKTNEQLKQELKKNKASTDGTKHQLIVRLANIRHHETVRAEGENASGKQDQDTDDSVEEKEKEKLAPSWFKDSTETNELQVFLEAIEQSENVLNKSLEFFEIKRPDSDDDATQQKNVLSLLAAKVAEYRKSYAKEEAQNKRRTGPRRFHVDLVDEENTGTPNSRKSDKSKRRKEGSGKKKYTKRLKSLLQHIAKGSDSEDESGESDSDSDQDIGKIVSLFHPSLISRKVALKMKKGKIDPVDLPLSLLRPKDWTNRHKKSVRLGSFKISEGVAENNSNVSKSEATRLIFLFLQLAYAARPPLEQPEIKQAERDLSYFLKRAEQQPSDFIIEQFNDARAEVSNNRRNNKLEWAILSSTILTVAKLPMPKKAFFDRNLRNGENKAPTNGFKNQNKQNRLSIKECTAKKLCFWWLKDGECRKGKTCLFAQSHK